MQIFILLFLLDQKERKNQGYNNLPKQKIFLAKTS